MSGIKQPVTQVRLTNVAVVRYKTKGHRYEIACYKNKVLSWRSGVEHDIDEVLQSRHIFANVSKGVLAGDEALLADFSTREEAHIAKVILDKGEIQVSEKERAAALDAIFRDIAVLVSDMCVNPTSRRPYPVRMIEQGMRDAHYSIRQTKSAKSQALAVIKLLQQHMPLDRAHMRVVVTCEVGAGKELKRRLQPLIHTIESEEWGGVEYRVQVLLSPGNYRQVEELVASQAKGRAHLEIVDVKATEEAIGDEEDDEDGEAHSDDEDEQPSSLPVIHQPAARPASATAAVTKQLAATHLTEQPVQSAAAASGRSKKAMRKVLDEEDIRTVGERREWEEDVGEVEDTNELRQRQMQAARKAKKERKHKGKAAKGREDDDDEAEEAEGGKGRAKGSKAAQDEDGEEAEEEADGSTKTGKKAAAALQAVNEEDDEVEDGAVKGKKKKGRRRKPKVAVVGSVTSLQSHSNDDED